MKLTPEDGKSLIKIAKESIYSYFSDESLNIDSSIKKKYSEKRGVFVTIKIDGQLRGCIGYTLPLFPLWEGISKAARAAAFEDHRFMPLSETELKQIKVEVSVLTKPELIEGKPSNYREKISVGKHGLMIENSLSSGLLLPQVFTEYCADAEKALEMTCQKAGLDPSAWKNPDCKVYKFSAIIFKE